MKPPGSSAPCLSLCEPADLSTENIEASLFSFPRGKKNLPSQKDLKVVFSKQQVNGGNMT